MAPNDANTTTTGSDKPNADKNHLLVFFVNGHKIEEPCADPGETLLTYLRSKLGLCGTKLGCGEGGCGACTVMLSCLDCDLKVQHFSVNACLAPVCSLHGMAVTTIEGIGNTGTKLHAVQQRMADSHGSQCGFCTPGIVMSMYTLLRNKPKPSMDDIETYFQGNLCRCTGYRPILEGYKTFTEEWSHTKVSSNGCCSGPKNGVCCMQNVDENDDDKLKLIDGRKFVPHDPSQEPIFPPDLKLRHDLYSKQSLEFRSKRMTWYRPSSLNEMFEQKLNHPNAKIVVGNTELGIEMKFKHCEYPVMIQPNKVPELNQISWSDKGLTVGAAVTLTRLENALLQGIYQQPAYATSVFVQIVEMLRWFAGKQIRNVAAVGGNIITGSPISDLNPIFMAAGSVMEIGSKKGGVRQVKFDQNFYTGYRQTVLEADEILLGLTIPYMTKQEYFVAYKQARRRDDDIAIVNGAFYFHLDQDANIINARMAFGGMSYTTKMATKTAAFMIGKGKWSMDTVEEAIDVLLTEMTLPPNVPGSMVRYRQSLATSFLFKAFLHTSLESKAFDVPETYKSATNVFHRGPFQSSQLFDVVPEGKQVDPVGCPIKHKSADKQATGEAVYVDDLPRYKNELFGGFVTSTHAHAKIESIDPSEALEEEGVVDFVCHKDLPESRNNFRMVIDIDEWLFASGLVECVGQIIGIVLAVDQDTAQRAARKVAITYKPLKAIITTEEAIEQQSFMPMFADHVCNADVQSILEKSDHIKVLTGEMHCGAQEHFYMEPQATLAVPSLEDGEMTIFSATQNPTETQRCVAHALGQPMSRVVCRVKRIGGGFGGKETRSIPLAMAAAVAAAKVKRPVRICLDRDEDMVMCGQRHPVISRYSVGYSQDGLVKAVSVHVYCNGGHTMDLTFAVAHRALFHMDNSYAIKAMDVKCYSCKTNLMSNTAFRGFGGPQGMLAVENWMEDIAWNLNRDPAQVREKNLYAQVDKTFYNMAMDNCTIRKCWQECLQMSRYYETKKQLEQWNKEHRWHKRGISIIPVKFGIAFTGEHVNQAGALVQVYTDGSVLLTHSGTEMGQGLHTKMIQVASKVLGISHEKIHISEISTDKVPNTPPTAASMGSDLNGMAVKDACEKIMSRLEVYKKNMPVGSSWEEWVAKANFDRVSLSATGFHATPDIGYDWNTNTGNPFAYFTTGVGASVVQIDCLTGDHHVLKTDIVMDLGESLNPAIDVGQIEGAFAQGYGLFMMEQVIHSPDGVLLTKGPGAYKLPGFGDMPAQLNVALLRGSSNPRAVFSSKAVGEPPLFLAASVFFAVKDAIKAARAEVGITGTFQLDSPATAERIRMACEDKFTQKVPQLPPKGTYKPWGIQV